MCSLHMATRGKSRHPEGPLDGLGGLRAIPLGVVEGTARPCLGPASPGASAPGAQSN